MHSTIFQVAKTKMVQDDHISCYDFPEYFCGKFGIDWVGDERDDEEGFVSLESCIPSEIFTVNRDKRSITVNQDNIKLILRQMVETIRKAANELNEGNIVDWYQTYMLEHVIENYMDNNALFYYENELMGLNQFIKDVAAAHDCSTLYIGAMLDYHI